MTTPLDLVVGPASATDLDGILAVQEENQPEHGGALSARFAPEWFQRAMESHWLLVARVDGRIAGYVAFTPPEAQAHVPIIQAMLEAYPNPGAYLHGPICVARDFRRLGVAQALFRAQRSQMDDAPVLAFIRHDNLASRSAHAGMGLDEVAEFEHGGSRFVVVAG